VRRAEELAVAPLDAFAAIREDRVVAVVRAPRVPDPQGLVLALAGAGVRCVEFTFTTPDAEALIAAAAPTPGAVVGAGTLLRREQAEAAARAGARFLVSPAVRPEVADVAREHGLPAFLGAFTPSEVLAAVEAGATGVKLFPARLGGPSYLRDLLGPFPDLALLPSGGVTEANAREYLAAGAVAVYAGSGLTPPEVVAAGDHAELARRARAFVAALR
jgi:2-dehydro-3-deoxyphosphogluconate aldolase/(4S)-4-hydroxy-2-oxoglutarate aldolase